MHCPHQLHAPRASCSQHKQQNFCILLLKAFWAAEDGVAFLQGMLEGIADIEAQAYKLLADMGASPLTEVRRYLPATLPLRQ